MNHLTPKVPLCGHATLATAKVLFDVAGNINGSVKFSTLSGKLVVRRGTAAAGGGLVMDFPQNVPSTCRPGEFDRLVSEVIF